jgi:Mu transposase, C-terminal domain
MPGDPEAKAWWSGPTANSTPRSCRDGRSPRRRTSTSSSSSGWHGPTTECIAGSAVGPSIAWCRSQSHASPATDGPDHRMAPHRAPAPGLLVRVDHNDYSVHPAVVGRRVEVHGDLERVVVTCGGRIVADHATCWRATRASPIRITLERPRSLATGGRSCTSNKERSRSNNARSPTTTGFLGSICPARHPRADPSRALRASQRPVCPRDWRDGGQDPRCRLGDRVSHPPPEGPHDPPGRPPASRAGEIGVVSSTAQ